MVYTEQTANNYCSLVFNGIFYQNNSASPCCAMEPEPASPNEYIVSKKTLKLQQDITNGLKPNRCDNCWTREKFGYKSIRLSFLHRQKQLNKITHMELRESNLCNFACRMCNANDSIVIEREIKANPELQQFFSLYDEKPTTNENWNQILELAKNVESVILTGGEPMLMKRYFDFLDYLISIGKQNIRLIIYTNGSVYNPIFVEKIKKFPNMSLFISIDAIEKVAEYQRRGTKWNVVRENILRFTELPITIKLHSTMIAYSVLDVSRLADFFIELSQTKMNATLLPFTAQFAREPKALEFVNLNRELKFRAIQEIDGAIQKLSDHNIFKIYVKELSSARRQLLTRKDGKYDLFVRMTKALDASRNESFEEVFGYKLV
jgi:sulfatase maturation enzyme AslB (radical SAM superfamily)